MTIKRAVFRPRRVVVAFSLWLLLRPVLLSPSYRRSRRIAVPVVLPFRSCRRSRRVAVPVIPQSSSCYRSVSVVSSSLLTSLNVAENLQGRAADRPGENGDNKCNKQCSKCGKAEYSTAKR
jgi:hypothetical protein